MDNEIYKKPQWHKWIKQNINTDKFFVIIKLCIVCGEIRTEMIDMYKEEE